MSGRESAADLMIEAAHGSAVLSRSPHSPCTASWKACCTGSTSIGLNHLEMVVADGQPVRWALNLIHSVGLRQRVYGPSLTLSVLVRAAQENTPSLFLRKHAGVPGPAVAKLRERFPELIVAGSSLQPSGESQRKPPTDWRQNQAIWRANCVL